MEALQNHPALSSLSGFSLRPCYDTARLNQKETWGDGPQKLSFITSLKTITLFIYHTITYTSSAPLKNNSNLEMKKWPSKKSLINVSIFRHPFLCFLRKRDFGINTMPQYSSDLQSVFVPIAALSTLGARLNMNQGQPINNQVVKFVVLVEVSTILVKSACPWLTCWYLSGVCVLSSSLRYGTISFKFTYSTSQKSLNKRRVWTQKFFASRRVWMFNFLCADTRTRMNADACKNLQLHYLSKLLYV